MRACLKASYLVLAIGLLPMAGSAFPLNAKKAPETQADLLLIQKTLQEALPKAKAATICIDLGEDSGSGVIVSADGLIMTAAHVSGGVNKDVTVILPSGTEVKAETLGLMAEFDAALVQITEPNPEGGDYPFVEVNRSGDTKLGDWIFSLGHSGGFDKERGAVTRLGRLVRVANSTFQTDGTLIGGDSGGPLFDMEGRLIGIHSRVGGQLQMNMHVPIKVFTDGWERMLKSEFIGEGPFVEKPEKGKGYLGLATKDVDGGLEVTKVGKKSPAEEAGVKEGDLLVSLNGVELESREKLQEILAEMAAGDKLELKLKRDGKDETINFRLGAR